MVQRFKERIHTKLRRIDSGVQGPAHHLQSGPSAHRYVVVYEDGQRGDTPILCQSVLGVLQQNMGEWVGCSEYIQAGALSRVGIKGILAYSTSWEHASTHKEDQRT